ncbi:dCTP deaminase [Persephonella atlantica]|uniref:dCTP deaminase n=1 Tax=Persephonella atlantica TaxID=2699429 RepID=A0ABS1GF79_9AQUI|nr:dCTP deaminase [Persephonella atlantica]MBK3331567.1 dCTP deaminase [Persephonella atlantica]
MILKNKQIKELIKIGSIEINPFYEEAQLQASSVDLTLSDRVYRYPVELEPELQILDPKNPYLQIVEREYISAEGIVLKPGSFILAETKEYIKVSDNISLHIQPKFRLSKLGVQIVNAGWLEYGFEGNITLCLYNCNQLPVRLYEGMKIVQVFFEKTD